MIRWKKMKSKGQENGGREDSCRTKWTNETNLCTDARKEIEDAGLKAIASWQNRGLMESTEEEIWAALGQKTICWCEKYFKRVIGLHRKNRKKNFQKSETSQNREKDPSSQRTVNLTLDIKLPHSVALVSPISGPLTPWLIFRSRRLHLLTVTGTLLGA